jgi:uncharacterized membrane protein
MVTGEVDITINRPIQEVFAYVSDFQNSTKWQTGLVEIKEISEGPLTVGSKFSAVRNVMGDMLESVIQITNLNQNRLFAYKSISGSSPFKQSFLFETTARGTKVTTLFELFPTTLLDLAESLIATGLKRGMDADFDRLKIQLETGNQ